MTKAANEAAAAFTVKAAATVGSDKLGAASVTAVAAPLTSIEEIITEGRQGQWTMVSIIVTLKASYPKTLPSGRHTPHIGLMDAYVETGFSVHKGVDCLKASVAQPVPWMGLMLTVGALFTTTAGGEAANTNAGAREEGQRLSSSGF